jgi:polyisoprenyl-phosphate glycosyltransferase
MYSQVHEGLDIMAKNDLIKKIDYSIIIPVYCNEGSLTALYKRILSDVVKQNLSKSYEIIFIDDGSYDNSFEELNQLRQQDIEHIKLIKFTRNFGQGAAITAGYQYASGQCIINISADLQDPPSLINIMLEKYFKEKYEIVICYRESRDETFFRTITSKMFYKTINKLNFQKMPIGGFDFALISHRVKELMTKPEANPFWQGQILWTGYNIKFIPYKRAKREIGESKWTTSKKIKYLIDGIMAYSYFPLRIMSATGLMTAMLGFLYAVIIFLARIFGSIPIKGFAPLMIITLLLSGTQMLMLGIIGEYLWRVLDQVRNRPQFLIEKILSEQDPS